MEQQMQRSIAAGYPANCEYPVQAEPAEAHTPKLEHYAQEPEPKGKSKSRQIRCSECPRVLMSRKNFIKHAEDEHGFHLPIIRKSFDTPEEFDRWIVFLRDHRNTEFISKCGRKRLPDSTLLGYMICSRSGGSVSKDAGMRKKTAKSGKTCSAYLKVLYQGTGKVDVEGCIDHTGHDMNADRIEASREERNYITNWLNEGVPFTEVVARLEARRTQNPEFTEVKDDNVVPMEHPTSTDSPAPSTSARTESFTTTEHAETPELPHDGQMEASYMDTKRMKLEGSESPKSDSNEPIVVVDDEELPPRSQETPSSIAQPLSQQSLANPEAQQLESLPAGYVDVTLERRKLEMLESFQTALRRIEARTMDAAETALRFFIRELESLQKSSH